ncbi:SpoIIE family protein phosphatase [Streptomyces sp. YC504]|uniref:protein-serine/threonine phosphatase n=1 Tax=Streptomyces mesophilus TaxID=1775132 RepID=A0A6G4XB89_9ACTN|nr:SpoIIE family protein phosphatase [Streptomyces mesophilus]
MERCVVSTDASARRPPLSGDVQDVLADPLRLAEEYALLRDVVEGTEAAVSILDTQLRYRYVNPQMARMSGLPADAHLGRPLSAVLPGVKRSDEVLRKVLADGTPRQLVVSGRTWADSPYDRRVWRATYHRLQDRQGRVLGLVGIALEVSGRRQYVDELERAHRRLALLDTAATKIGTTSDVVTTCTELANFVVPELADAAGVELRLDESDVRWRAPQGVLRLRRTALALRPDLVPLAQAAAKPGQLIDYQPGAAIRQCLETGRSWLRNRITPPEWRAVAAQPELADGYIAAGYHSALVVPLIAEGHVLGSLSLARASGSAPFSRDDAVVAKELAARAAQGLARAMRFSREHTMALELQRSLLAEPSRAHQNLETAARYLPADDRALVGGDWYDTLSLSGGRTLLVIGDVMGHGVEAAVAMSHYRSTLRALAQAGLKPHQVLRHADRMVAESGFDRVATCLLALADPRDGSVTYASAGHLPPLALTFDQRARLISVPVGPPLGTGLGGYASSTVSCPAGGVLLLYTDGLIEHRDEDIDTSLYRLTRLRLPTTGPLMRIIDKALESLTPEGTDDIALLAARLECPATASISRTHGEL